MSTMQLDDIAAFKSGLLQPKTQTPTPTLTKTETKTKTETETSPPPADVEKKLVNLPSSLQAQEQDEPLLMENKQRFVLFPIKYHEVRPPPPTAWCTRARFS